jgi:hypothetical protein
MEKIICIIIIIILILCLLNDDNEHFESKKENLKGKNRYVCLYAYYEKNNDYKDNFKFFLENGILDYVDYYFIINDKCSVNLPEKKNIKIFNRKNIGYDFGAWSFGLEKLKNVYDYYIFMNTSVIGPYLDNNNQDWLEKFMELFNTKDVKLVGSTINILNPPHATHVQTMFFILDREAIEFLNSKDFFNEKEINKYDFNSIVNKKEIGLSQYILKNNWNINCIIPYYRNLDYRTLYHNINQPTEISDVVYNNSFFGRTLTPKEMVFYKKWRFT